jgi:hypothetical protein
MDTAEALTMSSDHTPNKQRRRSVYDPSLETAGLVLSGHAPRRNRSFGVSRSTSDPLATTSVPRRNVSGSSHHGNRVIPNYASRRYSDEEDNDTEDDIHNDLPEFGEGDEEDRRSSNTNVNVKWDKGEHDNDQLAGGWNGSTYENDPRITPAVRSYFEQQQVAVQRKRLLCVAIPLLLVGVALVSAVTMHTHNNKNTANAASDTDDWTQHVSPMATLLVGPPPPTDDLTMTCQLDRIQASASHRLECEQLCEVADCCDAGMVQSDLSCYADNVDVCNVYRAACDNLQWSSSAVSDSGSAWTDTVVPPAEAMTTTDDTDVDVVTSPPAVLEPVDATPENESVPTDATNEVPTTSETPVTTAAEVAATTTTMTAPPTAPASLALVCDADTLARPAGKEFCLDLCNNAPCCWQTGVPSCVDQYPTECQPYTMACTAVDATTDPSIVTSVQTACPESIVDATNDDAQVEACRAVCKPAAQCCDTLDDAGCPAGIDKTTYCQQYEPCQLLSMIGRVQDMGLVPNTADDVQNACPQSIVDSTDDAQVEACRAVCKPAAQCCDTPDDAGCPTNTDKETYCQQYEPCQLLSMIGRVQDMGLVPNTAVDVQIACPQSIVDSTDDEQVEACRAVCKPAAQCCDTPDDAGCPTNTDKETYCQQYEPCQLLSMIGRVQDVGLATEDAGTATSSAAEQIRQERIQACGAESTLHQCIVLCAAGRCCHPVIPEEACELVAPEIQCDDYAACSVLY